jgi:hypothetical protein
MKTFRRTLFLVVGFLVLGSTSQAAERKGAPAGGDTSFILENKAPSVIHSILVRLSGYARIHGFQ